MFCQKCFQQLLCSSGGLALTSGVQLSSALLPLLHFDNYTPVGFVMEFSPSLEKVLQSLPREILFFVFLLRRFFRKSSHLPWTKSSVVMLRTICTRLGPCVISLRFGH